MIYIIHEFREFKSSPKIFDFSPLNFASNILSRIHLLYYYLSLWKLVPMQGDQREGKIPKTLDLEVTEALNSLI